MKNLRNQLPVQYEPKLKSTIRKMILFVYHKQLLLIITYPIIARVVEEIWKRWRGGGGEVILKFNEYGF